MKYVTFSFDFDDGPLDDGPRASGRSADDREVGAESDSTAAGGSSARQKAPEASDREQDPFSFDPSEFSEDSVGSGGPYEHWVGDVPAGKPPMGLFGAVVGLSLVGLAVAVMLRQSWVGLGLGWLLAGPLAILVIGRYAQQDELQRSRPVYRGSALTRHSVALLGVLALASVAIVAVMAAGKAARAW